MSKFLINFGLIYLSLLVPLFIRLWRYEMPGSAWWDGIKASPFLLFLTMIVFLICGQVLAWTVGEPAMDKIPFLFIAIPAAAAVGILYAGGLYGDSQESNDLHLRGSQVYDGADHQKATRKFNKNGEQVLTIAGVGLNPEDETKHFKLIGVTGAGKSTAIRELMKGALNFGNRAIFTDPDGGYLARFHNSDRGDTILNPFEAGSVKWNLFSEIQNPYDVEQLASGLIPTIDDASGREWRGYARTFVTSVIRRCHQAGNHDTSELWRLLTRAPNDELRTFLADTPSQPFLEPDNARMFGSIRSVVSSAVAALEYIQDQQGTPFSIRNWVKSGQGALFIPYKAVQIAALRSIISAWMRLAIFETMNQPENQDQRLWFVIDELDALGPIDGLKDALARLRKFGGRCVLGFQSIAQVSSTYGENDAQTIVENCGNTLILRCSSSRQGGTSEFASRLIGDREVLRTEYSSSRGRDSFPSDKLHSHLTESQNARQVTERAVMPSEIEQLPDLSGYLKLATHLSWMRVTFPKTPA